MPDPNNASSNESSDPTIQSSGAAGDMDRTMPAAGVDADRTMPAQGTQGSSAATSSPHVEARLDRIGDCRIEKRLGSGGFGDVWLAVQESDLLKRRVAIKLLKRGMDSEAVLKRFELERQVLSTLNHPNIARLFGGGVTDDGRSYFILEYVEGLTLDLWCQRQELGVQERLAMLRQIASALAHAHEHGIVHRDIKPANVLVGVDGLPKLLDFGIAKIVTPDQIGNEFSHQTLPGEIGPLTPVYASPEQLRGEPLGVSTDIYSFGVMMYEILSGHLPFDFSKTPFEQVRKQVCEVTPPKPSDQAMTSLGVLKDAGKTTKSATTHSSPARLRKGLRGDLDNIVLMAMRKETGRRYASMHALIADIDAHLNGQTVSARPNSMPYRASKWMGRNRIRVLLSAACLAVVVAGPAWWVSAQRAAKARETLAEHAKEMKKEDALTQKRVEELGKQESEFAADPSKALQTLEDAQVSAKRNIIDRPDDPVPQRQLRDVLRKKAAIYERTRNLRDGLAVTGELLKSAREGYEKSKQEEDRTQLMLALQARGDMLFAANEFAEAQPIFEENLKLRKQICIDNPDDIKKMRSYSKALVRTHSVSQVTAQFDAAIVIAENLKKVRAEIMRKVGKAETAKDKSESDLSERDWMLAHYYLASDYLGASRLNDCDRESHAYMDIATQRLNKNRKEWQNHYDLCMGAELFFNIALERNDLQAAAEQTKQWIGSAKSAVEISQSENMALKQLFSASIENASTLNSQGKFEEALQCVREAFTMVENSRASAASKSKGEIMTPDLLLLVHAQEMRSLQGLHRDAEAVELIAPVLSIVALPQDGQEWHMAVARTMIEVARISPVPADAERHARKAIESAEKTKDVVFEALAHERASVALRALGRVDEANAQLQMAKSATQRIQTPRTQAIFQRLSAGSTPAPPALPTAPASGNTPPASGGKPG